VGEFENAVAEFEMRNARNENGGTLAAVLGGCEFC
jgi:hypothetical protein